MKGSISSITEVLIKLFLINWLLNYFTIKFDVHNCWLKLRDFLNIKCNLKNWLRKNMIQKNVSQKMWSEKMTPLKCPKKVLQKKCFKKKCFKKKCCKKSDNKKNKRVFGHFSSTLTDFGTHPPPSKKIFTLPSTIAIL